MLVPQPLAMQPSSGSATRRVQLSNCTSESVLKCPPLSENHLQAIEPRSSPRGGGFNLERSLVSMPCRRPSWGPPMTCDRMFRAPPSWRRFPALFSFPQLSPFFSAFLNLLLSLSFPLDRSKISSIASLYLVTVGHIRISNGSERSAPQSLAQHAVSKLGLPAQVWLCLWPIKLDGAALSSNDTFSTIIGPRARRRCPLRTMPVAAPQMSH